MQRVQQVPEAEVIAEYLRNEFYQPEFHADREKFAEHVYQPDLQSGVENATRRALLFRRRANLWRNLPSDIQWWEVRLEHADLDFIRIATRPEWKRIANGSMLLRDIAERLRSGLFHGSSVRKVHSIRYCLRPGLRHSTVLLLGIDERHPFTVLEGNHRLAAALFEPQRRELQHVPENSSANNDVLPNFRVITGFSPLMSDCGCYDSSRQNPWRRLRRKLKYIADKSNESRSDGVVNSAELVKI